MSNSDMRWVEEQPENATDIVDNFSRFKSTAVGFSPN